MGTSLHDNATLEELLKPTGFDMDSKIGSLPLKAFIGDGKNRVIDVTRNNGHLLISFDSSMEGEDVVIFIEGTAITVQEATVASKQVDIEYAGTEDIKVCVYNGFIVAGEIIDFPIPLGAEYSL